MKIIFRSNYHYLIDIFYLWFLNLQEQILYQLCNYNHSSNSNLYIVLIYYLKALISLAIIFKCNLKEPSNAII